MPDGLPTASEAAELTKLKVAENSSAIMAEIVEALNVAASKGQYSAFVTINSHQLTYIPYVIDVLHSSGYVATHKPAINQRDEDTIDFSWEAAKQ